MKRGYLILKVVFLCALLAGILWTMSSLNSGELQPKPGTAVDLLLGAPQKPANPENP